MCMLRMYRKWYFHQSFSGRLGSDRVFCHKGSSVVWGLPGRKGLLQLDRVFCWTWSAGGLDPRVLVKRLGR